MTDSFFLSRRALLHALAATGAASAAGWPLAGLARGAADNARGRYPRIATLIDEYVDKGRVANMVAALGWKQDPPAYIAQGATAFSGGVPAGPDTLYRIYSMTKPITGMAAMICVDEGLLALDQPIAEIIPAFGRMQVQKTYDGPITPDNLEPATRPITVRHCLTHTAGLGYGIVQSGPIAEAYRRQGVVPGLVSRMEMPGTFRGTPAGSLAIFAERLAALPLVYQPGTRWSYSVGLDLVGRLIEVVTGQPFDIFLRQRLFEPLGMDSTFFRVPQSEAARLAANYFVAGGMLLPIDLPHTSVFLDEPPFPFGGAGLVSSARDYDRFLQMLSGRGEIDGRRVMSEAAVRMGTSDLLPDTLAPGGGMIFSGRDFGFGAGGLVGRGDAAGLYGWAGAAGTGGYVNMDWGFRHTLMTQFMPITAYGLMEEFPLAAAADALGLMEQNR